MAITLFGKAVTPVDNNATGNPGPTVTVTPPGSMQAGDYVVVCVNLRGSQDITVGINGGQSWTSETLVSQGTTNRSKVFHCRFDGTWDANPRFDVASSTAGLTAVMLVFRGVDPTTAIDVAWAGAGYAAPTTPFDVARTGVTTQTANAMVVAFWTSQDDNTWVVQTGGWTQMSSPAQVRNLAGTDNSISAAWKIQASAGASGNVTNRQTVNGGDAGTTHILALREAQAEITGSLDKTLGAVTLEADGTVEAASISGILNATLGTLTSAASGAVDVAGQATPTLGAMTSSAAGAVEVQGSVSRTLDAVVVAAAGAVEVQGSSSSPLGAVTGVATGTVDVSGSLARTLEAVTSVGSGIVGDAPIEGSLSRTLGALTLSAQAAAEVKGNSSATLGALTLAASGQVETHGALGAMLGEVVAVAAGDVEVRAALAQTFAPMTVQASGAVLVQGLLAQTLGALTLEGSNEPPWTSYASPGEQYTSELQCVGFSGTAIAPGRTSTSIPDSATKTEL